MESEWPFLFAFLEIGQITLGNPDGGCELALNHSSPLTKDAKWVLAGCEPIDDLFGNQHLLATVEPFARLAHKPARPRIFFPFGCECDKPLIFAPRQHSQVLTAAALDELNFGHLALSIINIAATADGGDDDTVALLKKDYSPIAHA